MFERLGQKGQQVRITLSLYNAAGTALLSGVAGSITTSLRVNGAAAAETVTVAEQGSSGFYDFTFTPTVGGSPVGAVYLLHVVPPASSVTSPEDYAIQVFDSISVTPIGGSYFTTLANLREFLFAGASPSPGTGADALLANLIARATKEIQTFLHRVGFQNTYTEFKDGRHSDRIHVVERPIVSVTSLHDSLEQTWDATTEIAAADFLIDKVAGRIAKKYGVPFFDGFQNVRAVYVGGWATVPGDVEQACIDLASMKWEARQTLTVSSRTIGDGTVVSQREPHLTEAMKDLLAPYVNEVAW
jgi:hypothetical protein